MIPHHARASRYSVRKPFLLHQLPPGNLYGVIVTHPVPPRLLPRHAQAPSERLSRVVVKGVGFRI